jgi:hypothetical protein
VKGDRNIDLTITRGDSEPLNMEFLNDDGTPEDITDWIVEFTAKENMYSEDDIIARTITVHTDPALGQTAVNLIPADTSLFNQGKYWYKLRVTTDVGLVQTIMTGNLFVEV